MTLPRCCVEAELDGFTSEEHARVCLEPGPALPVQESPNTPHGASQSAPVPSRRGADQ